MSRAEVLAEFEKRRILPTAQRLEIAELLLRKPQHLSADKIIAQLHAANSTISKATVYNSLNLFVKSGIIKECVVDPERRYYDSTTTAHHHFFNVDTGELSDIPSQGIEVSGLPELPEGTQLEVAELVVRIRNLAQ